jgi:outer membrane receptor protein involved in Fe transport
MIAPSFHLPLPYAASLFQQRFKTGGIPMQATESSATALLCSRAGRFKATVSLIVILVSLVTVFSSPTLAQSTAAINGTVRDTSGAVIPGATLTLENLATGVKRSVTSNNVGVYAIPDVSPGKYTLTVSKAGFVAQSEVGFTLFVNQTVTFDFTLAVGSTAQQVTVQGTAAHLEASTAELGTAITGTQVTNLPLNGRNFTQLLTLTPGVSPISVAQNSSGFTANPVGTFTFPAVNGQSNRSNFFLLDGINDQGSFVSTYGVAPILDSIQEFKVQSHNDQASYGGVLGGIVNVVTKSGTNQFHGDAWEFLRNNALDARNPFLAKVTPFKQNQFGGTIGGPVILPGYNGRNRTFFFAGYEGFRNHTTAETLFRTPTTAELSGDLSDISAQIYNPFSTRPDPNKPGSFIRDPFMCDVAGAPLTPSAAGIQPAGTPCNIIPQNMLSPVATSYAKAVFPAPQFALNSLGVNGIDSTPLITPQDEAHLRLDEQINEKNSLWVRYTGMTQPQTASGGFPGLVQGTYYHGYNLGAGYTRSLGSQSLVSLEFGRVSIQDNLIQTLPRVSNTLATQLGFSSNFISGFPGGQTFLPAMNIGGGFVGFTGSYINNLHASNIYEGRGDYSLIHGHHLLQMGADFNSNNIALPVTNLWEGFSTAQTADLESSASTGSTLASFLLGVPISAQRRGVNETMHGGWVDGFYIQDQWKATDRLTVNLGFRYDVTLLPIYGSAADNNQFVGAFDFHNGTYILARVPAACSATQGAPCIPGGTLPAHVVPTPFSNHAIYHNTYDNWQPRLGLAYRLGSKTALRASFGRFFDNWAGVTETLQGYSGTWPTVASLANLSLNTPTASAPTPTASILDPLSLGTTVPLPAPNPFSLLQRSVDPLLQNPYSLQWNFGVERQLAANTVLTVNYVGSEDTRVDRGGVYNTALTPGPGNYQLRAPFPYIRSELYDRSVSTSNYNGLQASLSCKAASGINYLISYTWSKSMDYGCSGLYGVEGCSIDNPNDIRLDHSVSAYDLTHIFSGSLVYPLPFGSGGRFQTGSRLVDELVGHWQLNSITTLTSGTPFTVSAAGGDIANTGNFLNERADLVGNSQISNPTPLEWFNTTAFAKPAPFTFGTAGRNILRSNWYHNEDLSLFREFPITEGKTLEFRAEFFNAFNNVVWGTPDSTVGDTTFGKVLSIANRPRQIQFGLKLYF